MNIVNRSKVRGIQQLDAKHAVYQDVDGLWHLITETKETLIISKGYEAKILAVLAIKNEKQSKAA